MVNESTGVDRHPGGIEQDVNPVTGDVSVTLRNGDTRMYHIPVTSPPGSDNSTPPDSGMVLSIGSQKVNQPDPLASSAVTLADALGNLLGQGISVPDAGSPIVVSSPTNTNSSPSTLFVIIGLAAGGYFLYKRMHKNAE